MIDLYLGPFILPSTLSSFPIPNWEKHYKTMLPLPHWGHDVLRVMTQYWLSAKHSTWHLNITFRSHHNRTSHMFHRSTPIPFCQIFFHLYKSTTLSSVSFSHLSCGLSNSFREIIGFLVADFWWTGTFLLANSLACKRCICVRLQCALFN